MAYPTVSGIVRKIDVGEKKERERERQSNKISVQWIPRENVFIFLKNFKRYGHIYCILAWIVMVSINISLYLLIW